MANKAAGATKDRIKITTQPGKLVAKVVGHPQITISTEITFGQLAALAPFAAQVEQGELSEAKIAGVLFGDLLPAGLREKLAGLPAKDGLTIFYAWLGEAMKALEDLGEDEASS